MLQRDATPGLSRALIPVLMLAMGCLRAPDTPVEVEHAPLEVDSPFEHDWLPGTGRGTLSLVTPAGERVEIQLHVDSLAYTGGLLPGGPEAAAVQRWPAGDGQPRARWGAWDESIVDHDQGLEYTCGWSHNVGRGADGVPLRWLGGRVLEQGPGGFALAGVNGEHPFSVARWLRLLPDGTLLIRVRVTNLGSATSHFDLWTGDDPPTGAAEAWVDGRVLTHETSLDAYALGCVGIGNSALCTAPGSPPPTRAYVANGFAHADGDIDAGRALETVVVNVGWTDLRLPAGQSFEVQYALAEGSGPDAPVIEERDWRRLAGLEDLHPDVLASVHDRLKLAAVVVELEILPGGAEIECRASYRLENSGNDTVTRPVHIPFAVHDDQPYPHEVTISGVDHQVVEDGASFILAVPARGEATIELRYRQRVQGREATFVATGARAFSQPLDTVELSVIAPPGVRPTHISYDMQGPAETDGKAVYSTRLLRLLPDRDLTVRW